METLSIFEYYKKIGILNYVLSTYTNIPNTIQGLVNLLDREKINIWSYSIDDKEEIKNYDNIVIVEDLEGCQRYFETEETEEF